MHGMTSDKMLSTLLRPDAAYVVCMVVCASEAFKYLFKRRLSNACSSLKRRLGPVFLSLICLDSVSPSLDFLDPVRLGLQDAKHFACTKCRFPSI